ncbi:hypothetical protein [Rossellomorea marisflavi]|uniref:hypothetical protein n=1 Tax=Rossellomorea marisflavi TaxID=189381 RepID=UPI003D2F162F
MAKRSLTSFNDLATSKKANVKTESPKKENTDNNVNVNDDINKDININNDVNNNESDLMGQLKALADKGKKKSSDVGKPTGIYFEEDVLSVLKQLAKNGGRGAQSRIVNDATKAAFIQAGFLDKNGKKL